MTVPYTFANQSGNIPLAELDTNFANVKAAADTAGTVTTNAQPNITSVGVLTGLSVAGNINTEGNVVANNFVGTFAGNIANAVYATTAGTANTANTVTMAAQPNITSVGTLSSLAVAGNTTSGNLLTAGQSSTAGNVTGANILAGGNISATGNVTGGNISTAGNISVAGNVVASNFIGNISGNISNAVYATTAGSSNTANTVTLGTQTNITSVGTLLGLSVSGQISATGAIIGSNALISGSIGANVIGANTFTGGVVSVAGNISGNNIHASGEVSAVGNVTGDYFIGDGSQLTGITSDYGNANVATFLAALGSNTITTTGEVDLGNTFITGLLSSTGNITGANIIGYSVYANGIISASGNIDAPAFIGNLFGNSTSNIVITNTDHLQFNVSNVANVVYITDGGFYVGGGLGGFISASGNISGANINAVNDITGGNINTGGKVSATGTIFGNNAVISGSIGANVIGATTFTGGLISILGNIDSGNIHTSGKLCAVGAIIGSNAVISGSIGANVIGANTFTGGNISVVGNISSGNLSVGSGNVNVGNVVFALDSSKFNSAKWTLVETFANVNTYSSGNSSVTMTQTFNYYASNYNEFMIKLYPLPNNQYQKTVTFNNIPLNAITAGDSITIGTSWDPSPANNLDYSYVNWANLSSNAMVIHNSYTGAGNNPSINLYIYAR